MESYHAVFRAWNRSLGRQAIMALSLLFLAPIGCGDGSLNLDGPRSVGLSLKAVFSADVSGRVGAVDEWKVEVIRAGEGVIANAGGVVGPGQETVQVPVIQVTLKAECESLKVRIVLLSAGVEWWVAERQLQVCTQGENEVDVPETQFSWAGPPQPDLDAEVLRFTLRQGEQASQSFQILYQASGTLSWNVRAEGAAGGWLTLQPSNGSASSGQPGMVTVTANAEGMDVGQYSATVVVEGFNGPPQEVQIELTVLEIPRYTLNVNKAGQGTVTSAPAGISIGTGGTSGSAVYSEGTQVTLTATPSDGWRIADWGGACNSVSADSNQCFISMDSDKTASVTMTENTYSLNVSKTGQGTVTSVPAGISIGAGGTSGSAVYSEGTQVTLTATPSEGWSITDWGGACNSVPADSNQCVVTMNGDQSASVVMERDTYTLSVSKAGQGTVTSDPTGIAIGTAGVSDSGTFPSGEQVTLTATPSEGWRITNWGGACSSVPADSNQCVVTMNGDQSASVTMEQELYTLAVSKTGQGTVTSDPDGISIGEAGAADSGTFAFGTQVTLTATPSEGWRITDWGGVCDDVPSSSNQCVVTMDGDQSASVTMQQNTFVLDVSKTGQGTVTSIPAGISITTGGTADSGPFPEGTLVTLTATPSAGWQIADWGGACNSVPSSSNQCVVTMDADKSASVTMEQILRTLTVTKTGQGTVTSAPAGISIATGGTSDSGTFPQGTGVTLNVDPSSGWQITDWGGACNSVPASSNQCVVTMDADKSASVTLGQTAILRVSTDSLLFIAEGAQAPGTETFQITNDGVGTLTWNYLIWDNTTGCVNAVSLAPPSGSLGPGQSVTVTAEVDTGGCPSGWSQSGRGFTIWGSDGSLTEFQLGILTVPSPGPGIYGERYRRVCQNCCLSDPDGDWYQETVDYFDFQSDVSGATGTAERLFGTWTYSDGTSGTYTYVPGDGFITYFPDGQSGSVRTDPCYNFLDGARSWVDITLQLRDANGNLGNIVSFRITPG